jgi:hypothetical protein
MDQCEELIAEEQALGPSPTRTESALLRTYWSFGIEERVLY